MLVLLGEDLDVKLELLCADLRVRRRNGFLQHPLRYDSFQGDEIRSDEMEWMEIVRRGRYDGTG